jgi:hypothetical protein
MHIYIGSGISGNTFSKRKKILIHYTGLNRFNLLYYKVDLTRIKFLMLHLMFKKIVSRHTHSVE